MAVNEWIGNAIDVADICSLTASGTWVTGDTATLTINGKSLVVTLGTPVTTTDVATLIAAAVNATDRLSAATGSSNVGGQSVPEFAELIASSSGAVVTLTTRNAKDAGKPFQSYLTRADSAGSGDLGAVTSVQAATGKNWWSNASNWSLGSVPANDDVVLLRDSSVDILYGLPAGSLQVQIKKHNSFTGDVGLAKVNQDNPSKPYSEYRPRYVVLDDAGTGTSITHTIGLGAGSGGQLCNLRQNALTTTFLVECNGRPAADDQTVNNLIAPAGGVLSVKKGTVDGSDQNGGTASWSAINIAGRKGQLADIRVRIDQNAATNLAVNQLGGRLEITIAAWATNGIEMTGGEIVLNGPCPSIIWAEGAVHAVGTGTIAAAEQNPRAVLDASRGAGGLTITNMTRHEATQIIDPAGRITHTNPVLLSGTNFDGVKSDYGYNRTYQVAG